MKEVFFIPQKQNIYKLRAVLGISIYSSLFSDHFLLQLSRDLAAHSHPSETAATGAAKEKEAQAVLSGAGVVRAGVAFAVALLGKSLASDFLQPLDGTKKAAVASACSGKLLKRQSHAAVKGDPYVPLIQRHILMFLLDARMLVGVILLGGN